MGIPSYYEFAFIDSQTVRVMFSVTAKNTGDFCWFRSVLFFRRDFPAFIIGMNKPVKSLMAINQGQAL
jgi:hypothetical protein